MCVYIYIHDLQVTRVTYTRGQLLYTIQHDFREQSTHSQVQNVLSEAIRGASGMCLHAIPGVEIKLHLGAPAMALFGEAEGSIMETDGRITKQGGVITE